MWSRSRKGLALPISLPARPSLRADRRPVRGLRHEEGKNSRVLLSASERPSFRSAAFARQGAEEAGRGGPGRKFFEKPSEIVLGRFLSRAKIYSSPHRLPPVRATPRESLSCRGVSLRIASRVRAEIQIRQIPKFSQTLGRLHALACARAVSVPSFPRYSFFFLQTARVARVCPYSRRLLRVPERIERRQSRTSGT